MTRTLKGKTLFITGASRGVGLAIARRAAQDGANIAIAAKSATPQAKLPGTIFTAAQEIEALGGAALPLACDIRFEEQVAEAVEKAVQKFGGIDILVNNASAIDLRGIEALDIKRFDLMHQVNARGAYLCAKLVLPHLRKAQNPHILTLSPPPDLNPKWFSPNLAYTMAKYGMSLVTLGLAKELEDAGVGVSSLWPETMIATSAVGNLLGGEPALRHSRKPEIVADAAHAILIRPARGCRGAFFIDVRVLRDEGVTDFSAYAVDPSQKIFLDFFLDAPITEGVVSAGASLAALLRQASAERPK